MNEYVSYAYAIGTGSTEAITALQEAWFALTHTSPGGHEEAVYPLTSWFTWDEDQFDGPPMAPCGDATFALEVDPAEFRLSTDDYWNWAVIEPLLIAWQKHYQTPPIVVEEYTPALSFASASVTTGIIPGENVGFAAVIVNGETRSISTWFWLEAQMKELGLPWPPK